MESDPTPFAPANSAAAGAGDDLVDVVRPFLWIGALAFVTGFWGYLIAAPLIGG
jgi:hypothetical protein